ncbi:MAG: tetratricopeptide repeat protein [Pseudomonadota bacterium]
MKYVQLYVVVTMLAGGSALAHADSFEDGLLAAKAGDYATALAKWQDLAKQGNALAQFNIGIMYMHGRGVTQDYAQALQWYRLAATQGYAAAQLNIGVMYNKGQGVAANYFEAAQWFRQAAEQGVAKAHYNLAAMYAVGHGVPQDYVLAYTCFNLAEAYGYDKAAEDGGRIAHLLTPAQREEAQALAARWRPGKPLPSKMSASR